MGTIERDEASYLADFPQGDVRKEALKQALDIRKFEIELYWKRATYFWAFIAAAFTGYFALQRNPDPANVYIVVCLGFLFSLALYLVNRGSGAWQRSWEGHVDLLEDGIMGPLYKTYINRSAYKFLSLAEPYSFSPSRINNLLSLSVTLAWGILIARTLVKTKAFLPFQSGTIVAMTIFTAGFTLALLLAGRSRKGSTESSIEKRILEFKR